VINKAARMGFTICRPPVQDQDINNQALPKIKQIELRKNKMRLDVKPSLDATLERKMFVSPVENPIDCGYFSDR